MAGAGGARSKTMAVEKFSPHENMFLADSLFYQTITGSYAKSEGEYEWTEADMVLTPGLATTVACPWTKDMTLQVIHDVSTQDGEPVGLAPRNVLKRVLSLPPNRYRKKWRRNLSAMM